MEELLNKLKSLNAIRALGSYADYDPDGEHKDTIYFAEDLKKIYLNGEDYGGITTEQYNELIDLVNNKVEKVLGKQLSTEDFTTLLKQKLDGLTNYDDATLTTELNSLKSRLDTLVGSGDVTAVIDTFQEIEAFLQGITNTQTLTGLLQEMKSEIVAMIPASMFKGLGYSTNVDSYKETGYYIISDNGINESVVYYDLLIVYNASESIRQTWFRSNYIGTKFAIMTRRTKEDGTFEEWSYRTPYCGGTSSQFLKADGSVDGTAYLPKSGGNIVGTEGVVISCDTSHPTQSYTRYRINNEAKALVGYNSTYGAALYNYACSKYLNIKNDGTLQFGGNNVWHEGNDGSGSGLDADLLDGKHNGELTALYLGPAYHDTIASNYTVYNTVVPYRVLSENTGSLPHSDGANVVIDILRNGSNNYISQLGFTQSGFYFRSFSNEVPNTTTPWKQLAFTDSNVASADMLTTKRLTDEDLNDIKSNGAKYLVYYAKSDNTCVNVPDGLTIGFILHIFGSDNPNFCIQELVDSANGNIYKRTFTSGSIWSSWQQLATTDSGIDMLNTHSLTDEDLNNIKSNKFSFFNLGAYNTVTNKPNHFGTGYLFVFGLNSTTYCALILIGTGGSIWRRTCVDTVWNDWVQMASFNDTVAKLTSKLLTDEDLDDIKDVNFSSYFAATGNTCLNKPNGITSGPFTLTCTGYGLGGFTQIINNSAIQYRRVFIGTEWKPWLKLLTEDDITSLMERITALEAQINS